MPTYDLVIEIIRYLSDKFNDLEEYIYKNRSYLDKAFSNVKEIGCKDCIKSIHNDFIKIFKTEKDKAIKMIFIVCEKYIKNTNQKL